ncbi:NAD-dependent epimerase/dehydratase family protein [Alphaproteobacteria bacterium]|nr:NAD-dependent epimerase/dehydratase family protein [Alphaproteobacteria bacterium]
MQKVIVIGGSGFIGQALTKKLRNHGLDVTSIGSQQADLTKAGSMKSFSEDYDTIFHLAAWTQAGDFCLYHKGEQWLINQQINTNVLSWWREMQPEAKLIAFGTSCSYEPGSRHVEDEYLIGQPISDLYTYAMTKRMLLIGMQAMSHQFGMRHLLVVPSTVYGPNYMVEGKQLHFIFDLIRKILAGKHNKEDVILWGDGQQRRELIFIDDFLSDLLQLVALAENEIVNIGAATDHSIQEFAELICENVGFNPDLIIYDEARYVGAKSKVLNCDKLKSIISNFHRTDLKTGLGKTVDWMQEQMKLN